MKTEAASKFPPAGAQVRLASLAPLDKQEIGLLTSAAQNSRRLRAHGEIVAEGAPINASQIILSGWACRVRHFRDGRRQILGFLLPGDLIFAPEVPWSSPTTIAAVSEVSVCLAPEGQAGGALAKAYGTAAEIERFYLYRQVARLGRLNAYERLVDWFLEIHERSDAAGLVSSDRFPLPITQEILADALGLTSVHVNRTLQSLRREEVLELRGGTARLTDREALARAVEYRSPTYR